MKHTRQLIPGSGSKPYWQKPRSQKKAAYIGCKNQIRESSSALGGKFITDDYLHGQNTIVWIAFLGRRQPEYFRAALSTCAQTYKDAVEYVLFEYGQDPSGPLDRMISERQSIQTCPGFADKVRDLLDGEFRGKESALQNTVTHCHH